MADVATPKKRPKFKVADQSTSALKAMLNKNSGASAADVRKAIAELKKRGEATPPPALVTGGRGDNKDRMMNKGGYAMCGASNPATQASTKKMYGGGMTKKGM